MKVWKKIRYLTFLLILWGGQDLFAEKQTIYLRNGQILRGEIIQQAPTTLKVRLEDGTVKELIKKQIQRISFREPSAKELKEAEEKAKQAEVEKTPEPSPEVAAPPKEEPPFIPANPFDMDRTKRKDLEIWAGLGYGSYAPSTEQYWEKATSQIALLFGSVPQTIKNPSRERGPSRSLSIVYYWRRFAFGLHGNHFEGKTHFETLQSSNPLNYNEVTGSLSEKQSILKADLSFLALTNARFDLSPSLGYSQIWGKSSDGKGLGIGVYDGAIISTPTYQYSYLEHLRGPSVGLKTTIRINERWENRIELHYLMLTGNQFGSIKFADPFAGGPGSTATQSNNVSWQAKGFQISYKLAYRYTPTLSFWAGFQYFDWKYSVGSLDLDIQTGDALTNPQPIELLVLEQTLIRSAAASLSANSRSTSVELGAAKRFEFGKGN